MQYILALDQGTTSSRAKELGFSLMNTPRQPLRLNDLQIIGDTIAIRWSDGREDYFDAPTLRRLSPSAETRGETDLFGRRIGGDARTDFSGVRVQGWEPVGGYAIRFLFSDGHNTGLYSFSYLREQSDLLNNDS